VSHACAVNSKLQIDATAAVRYRVADDRTALTYGTASVPLRLGSSEFMVEAHVIDMLPEYDCILGDAWLLAHRAYLDYGLGECVFSVGRQRVRLRKTVSVQLACADDALVISALAVQHALGVSDDDPHAVTDMHLVVINPSSPEPFTPADSTGTELTPADIQGVLDQFSDVFKDELPVGVPDVVLDREVVPVIPGSNPPCGRVLRHSQLERQEVEQQITFLLEKGLIRPSSSPYGAPVLFVRKKDGALRMCIDYRGLNKITVKNKYPLPRIDDLLDRLQGAKFFSSLDLCSAYHQVRLVDSDVPKTALRCHMGSFEYLVCPFGLSNAPGHFQTVMSTVLGGATDCSVGPGKREYLRDFVVAYLDDILIYSKTAADHLRHLRTVLERLRKHRFYAKLKKCEFNKPAVKFLGHIVSAHGVQPDPQKIKAVLSWPVPTDVTALRSFLGLANYFRKFVLRYSHMVSPLTDILKLKHFPDVLPLEALQAIERVKTALTSAPCLALPDYSKPFEVVCDASIKGIGAILLQDGRPVAYESRKLTPAEQRWHTTEQELLAVVHAFKVWRCYLEGAVGVTVVTDHCPNTFFSTQPMLSRRQARWSEYLHQFNFGWLYVPPWPHQCC
jgi:hypothetical protein